MSPLPGAGSNRSSRAVDMPPYPGAVLQATRISDFVSRYEVVADGRPLTTWEPCGWWRTGGTFDLDGRQYDVRTTGWGTRYEMIDQFGMIVAEADGVGRKRWTVTAGGGTHEFRRASWWGEGRYDQLLVADGRPAGSIRRTSGVPDAEADLPGLALPVQVFMVVVVLLEWKKLAAAD
jgi:hypothetical protein